MSVAFTPDVAKRLLCAGQQERLEHYQGVVDSLARGETVTSAELYFVAVDVKKTADELADDVEMRHADLIDNEEDRQRNELLAKNASLHLQFKAKKAEFDATERKFDLEVAAHLRNCKAAYRQQHAAEVEAIDALRIAASHSLTKLTKPARRTNPSAIVTAIIAS